MSHNHDDEPYIIIEQHSAGVGPFIVGAALGAAVALLFAPQSGKRTRQQIERQAVVARRKAEEMAEDVADSVTERFNDARRKVEEQIDHARSTIDVKKRQVQRAVDAGRAAAGEARSELERRLAETKAAADGGTPRHEEEGAR